MKGDTALGIAFLALLLLSWRAKAEKEAEITALLYSYDGQVWLPLQGAVIDSSHVTVGVQWLSITASMGVTIVFSVDSETQEEVLGIDPGDTGRVDFSMTLDDGNYTAEVTLKETASGKVLDSRLATFKVATAPPPPAEFVLSGLTVSPAQAQVEDTISTSAVVKNIGGAPGNYSVLIICDELIAPITKTGTLLPGESTTISATWIARTEGIHEVTVDSLSATYEVVAVPPVCTVGATKCEGYDLYECQLVDPLTPDWVLVKTNSTDCGYVPPVCSIGETTCEGYDLHECKAVNGKAAWVLIERNSEICGYVPPVCSIGETKCEGYDLYTCQLVNETAAWVLTESNSETCGYVPPPPPAEFVVSRLTISPAQAHVDDLISTSAVVKNIGGAPGDYSVLIICDELVVPIPKTGTLLPGQSTTIYASWIARAEGVHEVTIDSLSATYEVVAVPPPPEKPGKITDIKVQVNSSWVSPVGLKFDVGSTVTLGVFWKNVTSDARVEATTSLVATKPNGEIVNVPPAGTETRNIPAGSAAYVKYLLLLDRGQAPDEPTWMIEAILDGDIV